MTRPCITRSRRRPVVGALAVAVLALVAVPHAGATTTAARSARAAYAVSPVRAGAVVTPLEGVAQFDHIVVLTEENESATTTFAAASPATYLKGLRSKGVFLPNYYGTGHVSLDNYIAMVSGQPPLPTSSTDCAGLSLFSCVQPQSSQASGRNLSDQLEGAGLSWKAYSDGASTPCFHAPYKAGDTAGDSFQGNATGGAKNYADRHNPFLYFADVIGNQSRCETHQRPFADLAADLKAKTLPAFSFISPDTCNDGHDNPCAGRSTGGLTTADAFAKANLPALLTFLAGHNGLLIVNFDEGGYPSGAPDVTSNSTDYYCPLCAGLGIGGRTGAILVSPRLVAGSTDDGAYDHYSLLRSIEDSFALSEHLGLSARAKPFVAAFAGISPPR